LKVHAYVDGELDAAAAREVEHHLETCADCAALKKQLDETRAAVRDTASYHRADPALRARVQGALPETPPPASERKHRFWGFWTGALSGALATAAAASVAFFLWLAPAVDPLVLDATNAHLRAIASDHLIDVASSDQHTVKPWLGSHADVSPPVGDFSRDGFTLVGGRVDFVGGARTAVTVYRHGAHVINVFTWANYREVLPRSATWNGYHVVFWRRGNLVSCAISDVAMGDLEKLSGLLQAAAMPSGRE
jgi:anti-sigma factor RsiW